jgi:hypothetical protein
MQTRWREEGSLPSIRIRLHLFLEGKPLMTNVLMRSLKKVSSFMQVMRARTDTLALIERERYVKDLFSNTKYSSRKRLEPFGFKVYSQYDEDGILQEIFQRIGVTSRTFIEFGVGNGLENNTLKLLLEGWGGLWIEGSENYGRQINRKFHDVIAESRLRFLRAFIDRDNINNLLGNYYNGEIDLLSIDIDGNDIYILEALQAVRPRVIVIEYNGKFPPPMNVAQCYNPQHRWDASDYSGSSLDAITRVAARKGYLLVGCGIVGLNAFFIREDLVLDRFEAPFTAENHYQPLRVFLRGTYISGHPPNWGPYQAM